MNIDTGTFSAVVAVLWRYAAPIGGLPVVAATIALTLMVTADKSDGGAHIARTGNGPGLAVERGGAATATPPGASGSDVAKGRRHTTQPQPLTIYLVGSVGEAVAMIPALEEASLLSGVADQAPLHHRYTVVVDGHELSTPGSLQKGQPPITVVDLR